MKFYTLIKNFYFTFILTSFILAAAPDWDCDGNGALDNHYDANTEILSGGKVVDRSNAKNFSVGADLKEPKSDLSF